MLFSAIDANKFFGKELGTKLMRRCQYNLGNVKYHKRSEHNSPNARLKHYDTSELLQYVISRKRDLVNGTKRNMAISEEFYKDVMIDMCEFGVYLATVEGLKDIEPCLGIDRD